MKKFYQYLGAIAALGMPPTASAYAGSPAWVSVDNLRARLIPAVKTIGDDTMIEAALDIELGDGWHTYWRVAGDAGLPPRFDWTASTNLETADVSYPVPTRKTEQGGFYTFGYDNRVTFPLNIALKEANTSAALNLKLDLMICKDICIPERVELSAVIPAGDGSASSLMPFIEKAKTKTPKAGDQPKLKINTVVAGPDALVVSAYAEGGFDKDADLFATSPNVILSLPPVFATDKKDGSNAMIRIPITPDIKNLSEDLKGQPLTLTLVNGKEAIEKTIEY